MVALCLARAQWRRLPPLLAVFEKEKKSPVTMVESLFSVRMSGDEAQLATDSTTTFPTQRGGGKIPAAVC